MIETILILLWILFIAVSLWVAFHCINKHTYEFQHFNRVDIPYITIDIQGNLLNMIVDTGCGISIIRKDVLSELEYETSPRNLSLAALTSDSLSSNTVSIPFNIGKKEFTEDFVVYPETDLANFQSQYGITMHGLLGTEFFKATKCQIDFVNHSVIFP